MDNNAYNDKYVSHTNIKQTFKLLQEIHINLTELYKILLNDSSKNSIIAKTLKNIIDDYDKHVYHALVKHFNKQGFNFNFFVKESKINKNKKDVIFTTLNNIKKLNNNVILFNETVNFLKANKILSGYLNNVVKKIN